MNAPRFTIRSPRRQAIALGLLLAAAVAWHFWTDENAYSGVVSSFFAILGLWAALSCAAWPIRLVTYAVVMIIYFGLNFDFTESRGAMDGRHGFDNAMLESRLLEPALLIFLAALSLRVCGATIATEEECARTRRRWRFTSRGMLMFTAYAAIVLCALRAVPRDAWFGEPVFWGTIIDVHAAQMVVTLLLTWVCLGRSRLLPRLFAMWLAVVVVYCARGLTSGPHVTFESLPFIIGEVVTLLVARVCGYRLYFGSHSATSQHTDGAAALATA